MSYTPNPMDTSRAVLPPELEALAEHLAENTHEVWAQTRVAQGWRYGPERSDADKLHPCLVPYDALPDSEKVYDRQTALETLRLIVSMGYTIQPPKDKA